MPICHQKGSIPAHCSRTPWAGVSSRAQQLALSFKWSLWSSQSVAQMGGEIRGNPCHCSGTRVSKWQIANDTAQLRILCSHLCCGTISIPFWKKVKHFRMEVAATHTWKFIPPGITFPTLRVRFSCQRGQMLSWIKWFIPNHHHQDGRKADGSHKCL